MPKQTNYVEFDKERIEKLAKSIGENIAKVIKRIFAACEFEQQGKASVDSSVNLDCKSLHQGGYLRGADYYAKLKQRNGGKA